MTKRILFNLMVAFFLLTGIASAQLSNADLVGYWQFEEISGTLAVDSSTNLLDGAISTGVDVGYLGRYGRAYGFDGTGWIDCGSNMISDLTGPITVMAWVKTSSNGTHNIISSAEGVSDYSWRLDSQNLGTKFEVSGSAFSWGTNLVKDGTWHHIVGVYDKTNATIYIDTVLDATGAGTADLLTGKGINIGAYSASENNFIGLMDDVAIFDGILTSNEIVTAYTGGVQVLMGGAPQPEWTNAPPNLMGYWQFEETSGNIAYDSSTNGLDGAISSNNVSMKYQGRWGKGYGFAGNPGYINLGTNEISAHTGSLTIMAYVNRSGGFSSYINSHSTNTFVTGTYPNIGDNLSWELGGDDKPRVKSYAAVEANTRNINSAVAIQQGDWYHLTAVYDASISQWHLYTNGVLDWSSATRVAQGLLTNGQINIGNRSGEGEQFQGSMDDVAIFGEALSSNQVYLAANESVQVLMGGPAQVDGTNVPVELIAWYEFEERVGATNAQDSSGNNLDGDILSDVGLDQYGKFGRSFYFNRDSLSQIDVPTNSLLDIEGPITVAAWFMTSSQQYKDIVAYDNLTNNASWNMGLIDLPTNNWSSMRMQYKGSGITLTNLAPPYLANDRQWHHCVWTFDRWTAENKVYFDGELAATKIHNTNPLDTGGNRRLVIGGHAGSGNAWQGWIDDVAVWNGVLSSNEIYTMYTGGVYALEGVPIPPDKEPELVGWWKLNELSGTNVFDSWTNELHGYATKTSITEYAGGKFGGALKFVRSDSHHLDLGNNEAIFLPGPITVTAWADITDGYTWGQGIALVGWNAGSRYWKIYSSSGAKFAIDGVGEAAIVTNYGIGDGVWDFYTAVYDRQGNEMRITVDNANTNFKGTNVLSAAPNIKDSGGFNHNFRVGGGSGDNGLGGYMDEISIWNGVLSSNDLHTIYTGGVAAVLGLPPEPAYVPELVAWWKLDEVSGNIAYDQTTNNVDGAHMPGVTVGQPGKFETSYYFDGTTNGWIDFGFSNAVSLSPGPLTIVAWVNHTASGWRRVLSCDWWDTSTNKWVTSWRVGAHDDGAQIDWAWRGDSDVTGLGIDDGNWHLITAVQDRYGPLPRTHLYVDDQLVGTHAGNQNQFANPGQLLVMGSRGGREEYFLGYIDDVAVFDGPLSSNDVAAIYAVGLAEFLLPTPKGSTLFVW